MKSITVIAVFLFAIIGINAQVGDIGQQVMVKAKVIDVNTKQPISIELEFQPSTGNKFVVKSKEGSGTFEQLFQANETYAVTFTGDNVYREESTFTPKSTEGYSEINYTFEVKGLAPGVVVEDLEIFGANSTDLTANGKEAINNMKISMRFNRNTEFIFQVNAPNKTLAENRLKTLKDYTSNWRRLLDRVVFQSGTGGNNLIIKVNKVEDVMK
ncbi:MAG: hypothetical protein WC121_09815 [Candidatus Kapaibacterium sp.]